MSFGEENQVPFSITSRVHSINMSYHLDVNFLNLAKVVFVSYLHCKVTLFFFPLSILCSLPYLIFKSSEAHVTNPHQPWW